MAADAEAIVVQLLVCYGCVVMKGMGLAQVVSEFVMCCFSDDGGAAITKEAL